MNVLKNNQSLFVVITTGFDNYYIIFRFDSGENFGVEKNAIWARSRNF